MHGVVKDKIGISRKNMGRDTDDFIDDPLVGVEVECEARVTGQGGPTQARPGAAARLHSLLFNEYAGGSLGSFGANTTLVKHDEHTTSIPRIILPW